jgi:DNA-binding MarR family transcriptional regulator
MRFICAASAAQFHQNVGKRAVTILKDAFFDVYTKFKIHFYREIFQRFQSREASLTTVETFCVETIHALGHPTVNEFASFMCISPPNAAYKVNSLIKKGYIRKVQSQEDRREYHLEITQKYIDDYNVSADYMVQVMDRIAQRFSPQDCAKLEEMLTVVGRELMPEVNIPGVSAKTE